MWWMTVVLCLPALDRAVCPTTYDILWLSARYTTTTFVLLASTTDDTQRRKLMEATAQVLCKPSGRYLFALDQAVHPMFIGQHWLRIAQVQAQTQRLPGNRYVPCAIIEAAEHVFIH